METDAPPLTVAEGILKDLAPELAPHVHSFLHGGQVGSLPMEADFAAPLTKLRALIDALSEASLRRRPNYHVFVLSVAVRLQSAVLHSTIRSTYAGRDIVTY